MYVKREGIEIKKNLDIVVLENALLSSDGIIFSCHWGETVRSIFVHQNVPPNSRRSIGPSYVLVGQLNSFHIPRIYKEGPYYNKKM